MIKKIVFAIILFFGVSSWAAEDTLYRWLVVYSIDGKTITRAATSSFGKFGVRRIGPYMCLCEVSKSMNKEGTYVELITFGCGTPEGKTYIVEINCHYPQKLCSGKLILPAIIEGEWFNVQILGHKR